MTGWLVLTDASRVKLGPFCNFYFFKEPGPALTRRGTHRFHIRTGKTGPGRSWPEVQRNEGEAFWVKVVTLSLQVVWREGQSVTLVRFKNPNESSKPPVRRTTRPS